MNKNDLITYTPDGLDELCKELTFLTEDDRKKIVLDTVAAVIRA